MEAVKWLVIVVILMLIIGLVIFRICLGGVMNIDESNPEKDKYDLHLNQYPENLKNKPFVIFLVKRKKNKS